MHKLVIHNLGPIRNCELACSQFMTLTGFQASGKSTIAKTIFYFRTIKDDIYNIFERQALTNSGIAQQETFQMSKMKELRDILREKFLRVFGSSWAMDSDMRIEYHFTENCFVAVSLQDDNYGSPNYVWIDLSPSITDFLKDKSNQLLAEAVGVSDDEKSRLYGKLCALFDDPYKTVYIPAGRSMLTLLSQQWAYIYAKMDSVQKRTIDYCTQDYIDRILTLKPEFSDGLEGIRSIAISKSAKKKETLDCALKLTHSVLRGKYSLSDGEERIFIDNGKYVKINFSSSGQQESVWILYLLFYYLSGNQQVLFIIEEPESHLFPESQKYIVELISLVRNSNHAVLLTTHSPYVLGALNNLLYADQFRNGFDAQAGLIIPKEYWLNPETFDAWFVSNGSAENCMDRELNMIQNERIDDISNVINSEYDRLFELKHPEEGGD